MVVNGKELHGGITTASVLKALCHSFTDSKTPQICDTILNPLGCEISTGDVNYQVSHTVRIRGMSKTIFAQFDEIDARLRSSLALRVHSCVNAVRLLPNITELFSGSIPKPSLDVS